MVGSLQRLPLTFGGEPALGMSVRCASTANVTISTGLNSGDTIDGVTLANGDLVLLKNQSTTNQNGVYLCGATPVRWRAFDRYNDHPGRLISVEQGTANANTLWLCTSTRGGTLGTTALAFAQQTPLGGVSAFALTLLDDTSASAALTTLTVPLQGYGYGCTLSNNGSDATNDIDITAGAWADSTGAVIMRPSAQTKRLDANWAAGTGNGFRNSAIAIANTTYHIYVVAKAGGADPDYYAHTSATVATVITALQAETGGSAYIYARRIGSILRVGAAIVAFSQLGDEFLIKSPPVDISISNLGTSAVLYTLSVPGGIQVLAKIAGRIANATVNGEVYFSSPDQTDIAATANGPIEGGTAGYAGIGYPLIRTNTSSQIRARASLANTTVDASTLGWIDTRGRLS